MNAFAKLATLTLCAFACTGCKSRSPAPGSQAAQQQLAASATPPTPPTPARPAVPPPPFKVFHRTTDSITLVTAENATDDQIAAIIWQLHDAATNHSFTQLGIPQTFVDARDPIVWFHIYRGSKCAAEKYASGALPCGGGYHAAGDYTLGSFVNKNRDDGALIHGDDQETHLWPVA